MSRANIQRKTGTIADLSAGEAPAAAVPKGEIMSMGRKLSAWLARREKVKPRFNPPRK